MRCEAILADPRVIHQSAHDHVPAQQPLQTAEDEQQPQVRQEAGAQAPAQPEIQHGQQEDNADQPTEHPVQILEHEDALEALQIHAAVDLEVLRELSVFVEGFLPGLLGQGRNHTHQRFPFDHRQPRSGQAGHRAEQDHAEHHRGAEYQPQGHLAVVMRLSRFCHGVYRRGEGGEMIPEFNGGYRAP